MIIDILVILGACAVFVLAALKFGKKILTPLIFAAIISVPVFKYFVLDSAFFSINTNSSLIPYLIILLLLYFALKSHVKGGSFKGQKGISKAVFASASLTLLLITIYFTFLPESIYRFSSDVKDLLIINNLSTTLGIYMVAAIVAVYIMKPKKD